MPPLSRSRSALHAAIAALAAACAGPVATETPPPAVTAAPTVAPIVTPSPMPLGPLAGVGPLGQGEYDTPAGFAPAFGFSIRTDGWRSIVEPDELGFALATPNLASPQAIIGLALPVATAVDAFEAELRSGGFLTDATTTEDLELDGVPARAYAATLTESKQAFTLKSKGEDVQTAFGGELAQNRLVFVAHPDGPFVLIFSAASDAPVEAPFAFSRLLESIDFR